MNVLIIGPYLFGGGISTVINSVLKEKYFSNDIKFGKLNTTQYKHGTRWRNIIEGIKAYIQFFRIIWFFDIVHIHASSGKSFYRKSFFIFFAKLLKRKTILHIHASHFHEFFLVHHLNLQNIFIKGIFFFTDQIIVLCKNWEIKMLKKFPEKRLTTIYNPLPIPVVFDNYQKDKGKCINIIFLGFYIKSKGLYDLIETGKRLIEKRLNFSLTIYGKGELDKTVNELIAKNNLKPFVSNEGWIDGIEKDKILREADILFLPSYNEGMPMVILEAMAHGLAIVSTDISGIPEQIVHGKNGFLSRPGNVDKFVEYLALLIEDNELRTAMKLNNYERCSLFNPQKIAHQWESIYRALL